MEHNECWLEWAKELQFLSQVGLTYSKDVFDKERYNRIREIAAEMVSYQTKIPIKKVKELFCNETGFQTPKLETRAAIFNNEKILLVKETNGKWSLPGGWVDVNQSIRSNVIKEAKEEAGLDVEFVKLIALHDRNKHNKPIYAYGICKVFILCNMIGGSFTPNNETIDSKFWGIDEIPILDESKNNMDQIKMCFDAYQNDDWEVQID